MNETRDGDAEHKRCKCERVCNLCYFLSDESKSKGMGMSNDTGYCGSVGYGTVPSYDLQSSWAVARSEAV